MKSLVYALGILFLLNLNSCGQRVVVRQPSNVTVVKALPKHYTVKRVKGTRYYYWNGRYHRKTARGYVVVNI